MEIKQDLKNDFAWSLFQRYMKYCDKEGEDNGFQHFTDYLIRCGVIRERTVARFMVNELYPQALAASGGRKAEAIAIVSEETGLSESLVKNILTRPERYSYNCK